MTKILADSKGKYFQANTGKKFYLKTTPPFQPIDKSKPKKEQLRIARASSSKKKA